MGSFRGLYKQRKLGLLRVEETVFPGCEWSHRLLLFTALAAGVMLVAGCSSAGSESGADVPATAESEGTVNPDDALFQLRFLGCLAEAGIPAEFTDDGGVHMIPPPGQEAAANAAAQRCTEELGYSGTPSPLDEATLRAIFPRYVEAIECLRTNGYDPNSPVSQEAYVEAQVSPYEGIDLGTLDLEVLARCPEPRP
ncbi:MAG: hypothetical protein ACR2JG_12445 [Geodermatophilaceae bacterium]